MLYHHFQFGNYSNNYILSLVNFLLLPIPFIDYFVSHIQLYIALSSLFLLYRDGYFPLVSINSFAYSYFYIHSLSKSVSHYQFGNYSNNYILSSVSYLFVPFPFIAFFVSHIQKLNDFSSLFLLCWDGYF